MSLANKKKKTLGRGIGAMMGADQVDAILEGGDNQNIMELPLTQIIPNPNQPRKNFSEDLLQSLADSIKANGIIQPIVVHKKDNSYQIIAGERRYRAAKMAGLKKIPVIVRDVSEIEKHTLALIENIQREELGPIEEAKAYQVLMQTFQLKQQEVADRVGKDRATIANMIRLLDLAPQIQQALAEKKITSGHARAILPLKDEEERLRALDIIVQKNLSVRQVENQIRDNTLWDEEAEIKEKTVVKKKIGKATKTNEENKDAQIKMLEADLRSALGTKVLIQYKNKKGKIEIFFYSLDDFDRIKEILAP